MNCALHSDFTQRPDRLCIEQACFSTDGVLLLDRISINLHLKPLTLVLGANGAGKSLFLNLCHGLLAPTGGRLSWRQATDEGTCLPPSQALVFQTPVMLNRTVAENLRYVLRNEGVQEAEQKAKQALEWAGLAHLAMRNARLLSLGEQQQVAIARARVLAPQLLWLDEPTASLDPGASRRIEALIVDLHANGTSVVMTSHNLAQAKRLAQKIVFLNDGRVLEYQDAERFFSKPETEQAKAFIQWESPV